MNVLGTGLSGLVGSRLVALLSSQSEFEDLSQETGVDITQYGEVASRIKASRASWVFHLAAYTDVQGAEKTKEGGKESLVWKVNVDATENIAKLCRQYGKHMLYLSTDYVFDGTKKEYKEADVPSPQGWYAVTKYEGEKHVLAMGELGLVIRISNPYRANPISKRDWVHKMMDRLVAGQPIAAPQDQLFVPTFIDDLARVITSLTEANTSGIVHAGGGSAVSPYEAAGKIATTFGYDTKLVSPTKYAQFIGGRAPYPQYAVLVNETLGRMALAMRTFDEGLAEVKRQET
jgi:dTDP-4-dehydrorhamnose reductase